MGLKHESISDPALAKPHTAGARVTVLQQAEHARYGTISYEIRRLWTLHYAMAHSGYVSLRSHHERVLRLPVLNTNSRMISATEQPDLILMIYSAGTQMVLNTVLTMQHFCEEIERYLDVQLQETGTSGRIKEAFTLAGLQANSLREAGYSGFQEILERRDSVEHPKKSNVFNSDPLHWDQVPLNWFLTDRPLQTFTSWNEWFSRAVHAWKAHAVHTPRSVTVTVERGKMSTRQAKKPPKEPAGPDAP
jgi:hypothetical protein